MNIGLFEELFRKHYRFLSAVAFRILKDKDTANDIVQNFYLDLWQKRHEATIIQTFQAYATRAVKNGAISYLRQQQKVDLITINDYESEIAEASQQETEEALMEKEIADMRVMKAVDLLPDGRKKIFLSYVVDGMSYAEIAQKNGISVNTVKTQMKRAYAFLKERMEDDTMGAMLLSVMLMAVK